MICDPLASNEKCVSEMKSIYAYIKIKNYTLLKVTNTEGPKPFRGQCVLQY